jgi:acetoin utilization protein AcuB
MLIDSSQDMLVGEDVPVAGFMTASPITTDPMDPLESATDVMRKNRIGGLPVVGQDGAIVGILTESDICRAVIDILAAGADGARIELQIGRNAADIYEIFRILKDYDMQVKSVSLFAGFSETSQLLTVRVLGEEMEKMLDALWKSGRKVHRVMVDDTDG